MNEWGFAGEIKSWWDAAISEQRELKLGDVRIEESPEGDARRSDLTVYDSDGQHLMVVELRLPDHLQPNPDDISNIENAMLKALAVGARWSATTDGRTFRLLDHSRPDRPTRERAVPVPDLTTAATRKSLDVPATRGLVGQAWKHFILNLAPVLTGREEAPRVPPDVFFVDSLRASLSRPFAATRDTISARAAIEPDFAAYLVRWMVDEQGWPHDAEKFDDEITHVAQIATYVFATRLLFYGALRRAQPALPQLDLPIKTNAATNLAIIDSLFSQARQITGDYETVFLVDDVTRWALISDLSCHGWSEVIALLEHFQLETISFDVLGRLFERLIDPHERYVWGQHYTAPDVVDLMLSAAMPNGLGSVADFACGGGTFLVRAYTRKKAFEPESNHDNLLRKIFGNDISAFAASVSTISLAAQHLASGSNYPQIRVGSFFGIDPGGHFVSLPSGQGEGPKMREVPPLDAIVCNPPYIAYSNIGEERASEAIRAYQRYPTARPPLRGKWNYHLPFWFHSASFLAEGGKLAFITSGEWLDSDYGVQLQDWLTSEFHIELVVESMAEQWFGEARVGTVVLIARERRLGQVGLDDLQSRFVALRRPLSELYGASTADDTIRLLAVDAFRDRLMSLDGSGETDDFDYEVISQRALRDMGTTDGRFIGTPWRSRFLRSPHIARALDRRPDCIEVSEIANVSLGSKTGADNFFFLRVLGSAPGGKLHVRGFGSWSGEISRRHVRPAIRRPAELDLDDGGRKIVIDASKCNSVYFHPTSKARDSSMLEYVHAGEVARISSQKLVKDNAGDLWYIQKRSVDASAWVLPYNSAYDYFAADNRSARAVLNGRLVGLEPKPDIDSELLGAVMNSTFALIARLLVGVQTGNEAAYDVGPPSVRKMRVPDPRQFSDSGAEDVRAIFKTILEHDRVPPAPGPSGSVDPLRRRLDAAILRALGMGAGDAALLLDELYAGYGRWRRAVRVVELQVQDNRRTLAARGGGRGQDPIERAAARLLDEIRPDVFVDFSLLKTVREFDAIDPLAPKRDEQDALIPRTTLVLRSGETVDLGSGDRVALVAELRSLGVSGVLHVPQSEALCGRVLDQITGARRRVVTEARSHAVASVGEESADRVVEIVTKKWESELVASVAANRPTSAREPTGHPANRSQAHEQPSLLKPDGLVPPVPLDMRL